MVCVEGCPYKLGDRILFQNREGIVSRQVVLGKCTCKIVEITFDDNGSKRIFNTSEYSQLINI